MAGNTCLALQHYSFGKLSFKSDKAFNILKSVFFQAFPPTTYSIRWNSGGSHMLRLYINSISE